MDGLASLTKPIYVCKKAKNWLKIQKLALIGWLTTQKGFQLAIAIDVTLQNLSYDSTPHPIYTKS